MALIIIDFPNINKKVTWSTTSCWQKCNFCWKNYNKICNYQSYPYLMWKNSNIVWITLHKIFLCTIIIDTQFLFSFKHLKISFPHWPPLWNHVRIFWYCRIFQNCLMFLQGVYVYIEIIICTLQEHQMIPTNVTVSKVSDIENEWWSMRKLVF